MRISVVVVMLAAAAPATASDRTLRTLADIGAYGLPVAAGGYSLARDDQRGLLQLGESYAVTFGATQALKYAINERRPNGGNHSFPSGHTSSAFSAAAYLHVRYGWQVGVPAEVIATAVGISRVVTHDHHWYDVVAGAALGGGTALAFTRKLDSRVDVTPFAETGGGGVSLTAHF